MKRLEPPDLPLDPAGSTVFGEPHQTADGATVITAARVRVGAEGSSVTVAPLGVLVIRGDRARWVPTVNADRIALVGVLTGLLSAVIAALAVLRRPPWPDLRGSR